MFLGEKKFKCFDTGIIKLVLWFSFLPIWLIFLALWIYCVNWFALIGATRYITY